MYTSELLYDYIESLEVEGGRSSRTAANYTLYLQRFIEFTDDIKVGDIERETIRKYRLWLNRYQNPKLPFDCPTRLFAVPDGARY